MNSFSAQSIILWKREYGDHDFLVSLLARGHGRITALAKNAKKSVKRFGGVLELFTLVEAVLKPSKNQGLYNLSEVSLDSSFESIRTDYAKTSYAGFWSEILGRWIEENHPQDDIFLLFNYVLENLDNGLIPVETLDIVFQIKLLQLSGLSPDFSACSRCGKHPENLFDRKIVFDIKDGRIICSSCFSKYLAKPEKTVHVSRGTVNELRWIQKNDCSTALRIRLKSASVNESRAILEKFLPFHLGKELRSLRLLNRIRHEKIPDTFFDELSG